MVHFPSQPAQAKPLFCPASPGSPDYHPLNYPGIGAGGIGGGWSTKFKEEGSPTQYIRLTSNIAPASPGKTAF